MSEPFILSHGSVSTLEELSSALKQMDDSEYRKYVSNSKNDFYNWLKHSLREDRLARDCKRVFEKRNLIGLIDKRVSTKKSYEKSASNRFVAKKTDMYSDHLLFSVDKEICSGCEICTLVCPKEAIYIERNVIFVEDKCTRCGLCVLFCPVFAMSLTMNGSTILSTQKGMVPGFTEKEYNGTRARRMFEGTWMVEGECPEGCEECVKACPVNALSRQGMERPKVDAEDCLLCGACKNACPEGIILSRRSALLCDSKGFSSAFGKAVESLMGYKARALYHAEHSDMKLKKLVEDKIAKKT